MFEISLLFARSHTNAIELGICVKRGQSHLHSGGISALALLNHNFDTYSNNNDNNNDN